MVTHSKRSLPEAAYQLAYDWLLQHPDGVHRDSLLAEVKRHAWTLTHPGQPEPESIHAASKCPPNMLITFEKLGLLLSEDQKGMIYAWMPEQSTLSQTWQ